MVIKVYVSGISASPEIRSYQQRSTFILDSLRIDYESIDITDVGNEELKDMIKEKCKHRNEQPPKTPQFFNDDVYCGDWFDFEIASDEDRVLTWLGLEDTRYDDLLVDDIAPVKEIEGNENIENNQSIRTEIKDGILTTETITKEETIVFSKQNVKTAPIQVKLDDSGKEIIQFKNENGETEEENVFLENENNLQIIRGEEEIISSTRTQETNKNTEEEDENQEEAENLDEENQENDDLNENQENDDLNKNQENDDLNKNQENDDLNEKENLKNDDLDENGNLGDQDLNDSGVNEENNDEINENNDEQDEINESDEENSAIE